MKYLDGNYYVEVKDHLCRIHPTANFLIVLRDKPKSLRKQYSVQNNTQITKNQKGVKKDNNELIVKKYPINKQPIIQKQKIKQSKYLTCEQNNWLEFDKGYYCRNCEYAINKQKHQIDKKVLRQDRDFSTRLNYADKKLRKSWMKLVNTTNNSTEEMNNNLQQLKT